MTTKFNYDRVRIDRDDENFQNACTHSHTQWNIRFSRFFVSAILLVLGKTGITLWPPQHACMLKPQIWRRTSVRVCCAWIRSCFDVRVCVCVDAWPRFGPVGQMFQSIHERPTLKQSSIYLTLGWLIIYCFRLAYSLLVCVMNNRVDFPTNGLDSFVRGKKEMTLIDCILPIMHFSSAVESNISIEN